MKEILVLHTGGTISMQADEAGKVSPNQNNPMNQVGLSLEHIHLTVVDFFKSAKPTHHPSPHAQDVSLHSTKG